MAFKMKKGGGTANANTPGTFSLNDTNTLTELSKAQKNADSLPKNNNSYEFEKKLAQDLQNQKTADSTAHSQNAYYKSFTKGLYDFKIIPPERKEDGGFTSTAIVGKIGRPGSGSDNRPTFAASSGGYTRGSDELNRQANKDKSPGRFLDQQRAVFTQFKNQLTGKQPFTRTMVDGKVYDYNYVQKKKKN